MRFRGRRAKSWQAAVDAKFAQHAGSEVTPREMFRDVSDEAWLWANTEGVRNDPRIRELLPGLPDEKLQGQFTGSTGDWTLREGFQAYRLFKGFYEEYVGTFETCQRVLDFGCGWGRIIRFFLKDLEPSRLMGIDHLEDVIRTCHETNRWCQFQAIEPEPPTSLADDSFDLIYCYSVFSHLPEDFHKKWLIEFTRILKPGGLLVATTRRRDFIEHCAELRTRKNPEQIPHYVMVSAKTFLDTEASLAAYDRGEFCYSSHEKEGRWWYWGEACIPEQYVLNEWTKYFTYCEYMDDRRRCPQSAIVVRKPSSRD